MQNCTGCYSILGSQREPLQLLTTILCNCRYRPSSLDFTPTFWCSPFYPGDWKPENTLLRSPCQRVSCYILAVGGISWRLDDYSKKVFFPFVCLFLSCLLLLFTASGSEAQAVSKGVWPEAAVGADLAASCSMGSLRTAMLGLQNPPAAPPAPWQQLQSDGEQLLEF